MFKPLKLLLACAALGCGLAAPAHANPSYPEKPVTLLTPFAAGGTSDILARLIANHLNKLWGQPFVVQNKPGAGGQIALAQLAKSAPDGYTLSITSSGTTTIGPHLHKRPPYDGLKDFVNVTVLADTPFLLVVANESPIKDLKGYVAKAKADPGGLSLGVSGIGSHQYLAAHQLSSAADVKLNMIPYKGTAPQATDLLGGNLVSMLDNIATQVPLIQTGKVRPLAISTPQRVSLLPDVPTFAEAGVQGFQSIPWFGLAAPKGTPPAIVDKLYTAIAAYFRLPETRQQLEKLGMVLALPTPAETARRLAQESEELSRMIDKLGVEKQ